MVEEQSKIEKTARDRIAVDKHVFFDHVPSPGTHEKSRRIFTWARGTPLGPGFFECSLDGVFEIHLTLKDIVPGWRI